MLLYPRITFRRGRNAKKHQDVNCFEQETMAKRGFELEVFIPVFSLVRSNIFPFCSDFIVHRELLVRYFAALKENAHALVR